MLKNNQKGGRSGKTQPQFQQSDFRGLFRERKRPIEDPQIDLGLAQDRTYKVRKDLFGTLKYRSRLTWLSSGPNLQGEQADGAPCCKTDIL